MTVITEANLSPLVRDAFEAWQKGDKSVWRSLQAEAELAGFAGQARSEWICLAEGPN